MGREGVISVKAASKVVGFYAIIESNCLASAFAFMLSLNLLGPLTATLNGQPLTYFGTIRGQALMIYLAIENDRVHQREALMHLLWPAMPLKSAQGNLRQTI
jgi:pyrroloquinoline quinone (PQQ) biosynthesis protein C